MPKPEGPPLISIVTVSLDQGRFLGDTLRSVQEQTYPHIEHVVMDGGSTDNTLELLRAYEKECPFPLQWRSEPDRCQSHAYNKAFALCTGRWILYLNSGEFFFEPDSVEKALALMETKPGYQMYAFPYMQVSEDGSALRPFYRTMPVPEGGGEVRLRHMHEIDNYFLPHESTFFHRDLVERIRGYSEWFHWFVDVDFFCRALRQGPLWLFTDPSIVVMRNHEKSLAGGDSPAAGVPFIFRIWEQWWARVRTGAMPWSRLPRTYTARFLLELVRGAARGLGLRK